MAETSFTPYWRSLEPPAGPNSWIFFTVAKLAGCYQPVAAVSSVGWFPEESLQGTPLTVCCQRIVTIFSDPANHTAIRGELTLADAYYASEGTRKDRLVPVELPELTRRNPADPRRFRPWDRSSVVPFPFISALLLQGVAFDPRRGHGAPARPEPLTTVYRDTDLEWGMVVVDITDLKRVCYGIVGFAVAMAKFIPSLEAERRPFHYDARFHFEEGPLRVMDEVRPRRALSAAEYMEKFNYNSADYCDTSHDSHDIQILDSVPLVDAAALSLVWASAESTVARLPNMTVKPQSLNTQQDQAIKSLIQQTLHSDDFDISVFNHVRHLPSFKALVQEALQGHRDTLNDTRAIGRLIRIAYTRDDDSLGLELLGNLTPNIVSVALDDNLETDETITSLSLCIDSIHGTPAELATALSRASSLKEICLLQDPTRESDALSAQILTTLATQTDVLARAKVVFAGAYSSALRKKFWLQTSPSLMPRQVFPIQQIFVRHQREGRLASFEYNYIHLDDGLLKPERFAAGFLLWLSTLEPPSYAWFDEQAPFLAFSSAPASLTPDLLSAAEVTPILCENFALPISMPENTACSPRARDLAPEGWTVLVSQELNPSARGTNTCCIRYAFVRVRGQQSILVEDPLAPFPGPGEIEVTGLKEFLSITAPEMDRSIIDFCLDNTAKTIAALQTRDEPWESGVEPLSVLSEADAADILIEFLSDARALNRRHRKAMKEDHEINLEPLCQASVVKHAKAGVLIVTIYEARGLSLPEQYQDAFTSQHPTNSHSAANAQSLANSSRPTLSSQTPTTLSGCPDQPQTSSGRGFKGIPTTNGRVSGKYMPYALVDFDKVQVFINSVDGRPDNPLWAGSNTQYKFDVSRVEELTVHLFIRNPTAPPGSGRTQDIFLGVVRLNPRFEAKPPLEDGIWSKKDSDELASEFSGIGCVNIQNGTRKLQIGVDYTENDTSKLNINDFELLKVIGKGCFGKWTLGVLLYEMPTGLPPFYDENTNEMYRKISAESLHFLSSDVVPPAAKDLLTKLLNRDPTQRLGANGSVEIKSHPFFHAIDWIKLLQRKYEPAFKPNVANALDTTNFDPEFTSETPQDSYVDEPVLSQSMQHQFEGFSYRRPVPGLNDAGGSIKDPSFIDGLEDRR
ncbi:hypothetical protein GQX73_g7187 [Xylaria multiplex]|uniref:AGC-kinase C-terminal domain-containing protein n=1 Tax=Xylaria multiplex TaxID=323545 RepID=A0A7C8IQD7_9PEZI|nr:hypothetical protein GQX73_g7187 [Xylaria multiplex]